MRQWKNSVILKGFFWLVLILSVFADVIAGMGMIAGGAYASTEDKEKPKDFFVAREETNVLLDGYIRLFEEYMQIGSLITEDGDIDYDKEILVSLLDGKSYTIKELIRNSVSEGEAVENLRGFMADFAKNCEDGKSYPWYTRRALQSDTRLILEDGNIFQFQSPNAASFSRRKIADLAEHQENMVAISTDTQKFEENLGESIFAELPSGSGKELSFRARSAYEGYIIKYFPEYARWYYLNDLLEDYEDHEEGVGKGEFASAYNSYVEEDGDRVSEETFLQIIRQEAEECREALPEDRVPWSIHVIPRTMREAGKYVTFLVETYQELKYIFSHSNFVFAYENSKGLMITNNESIWTQIKNAAESGRAERKAVDSDSFLYAFFDSRGDEGKTNFLQESFGMSGSVLEKLRNIGTGYRAGSYRIAVGLDLREVRGGSREDEFSREYLLANQRLQMFAVGKSVLLASGVLTLLSFILLAVMSGNDGEAGDSGLRMHDRIWLEGQLVLGYIFGEMILWLLTLWNKSAVLPLILLFGTAVSVLCIFILGMLLSVIKRQKLHLGVRYSLVLLFISEVFVQRMRVGEWAERMKRRIACIPAGRKYAFLSAFELGSLLYWVGCMIFVKVDGEVSISSFLTSSFGILGIALVVICAITVLLWQRRACSDEEKEQRIIEGTKRIMEGDLAYQLPDYLGAGYRKAELVETINRIGGVLERAVEESVRNERLKTELIANVSHDIKTPLTSVINYVDLIKRQQVDNEQVRKYIAVLERKSLRLKTLIEDLVEASKASSGVMELEIHTLNFNELIRQTNGEFDDRFEECHLELISELPEETLFFQGDGRRVFRILENLYNNTAKYAMERTRVYVSLKREGENLVFTMKNISASKLNISPEELTERFVRGDRSRTTEGSGLGLSIAKSLTELMGGQFVIDLDGDLFCVKVLFPECSA